MTSTASAGPDSLRRNHDIVYFESYKTAKYGLSGSLRLGRLSALRKRSVLTFRDRLGNVYGVIAQTIGSIVRAQKGEYVNTNNQLKGVGGWLKLLIVGLCILGPLVSYGQNAGEIAKAEAANPSLTSLDSWQAFVAYSNWALIFSLAITFSAGHRLWKIHTSQSVRFAILAMWIAALFSIGTAALSSAGGEIAVGIIWGWIVALVWTLYWSGQSASKKPVLRGDWNCAQQFIQAEAASLLDLIQALGVATTLPQPPREALRKVTALDQAGSLHGQRSLEA